VNAKNQKQTLAERMMAAEDRKRDARRFQKGTGCYKCACCGKLTRSTGRGDNEHSELCAPCYDDGGIENQHSDNGHAGPIHRCPICAPDLSPFAIAQSEKAHAATTGEAEVPADLRGPSLTLDPKDAEIEALKAEIAAKAKVIEMLEAARDDARAKLTQAAAIIEGLDSAIDRLHEMRNAR